MSDSRGSRWNRGSGGNGRRSNSRSRRGQQHQSGSHDEYVPPNLGNTMSPSSPAGTSNSGGEYFVTSPPRKSGLTGSISTLFRRAASREPGKRDHRRSRANSNDRGSGVGTSRSGGQHSVGSPDSLLASSPPTSPNEERAHAAAGLSISGSGVIDSPASGRAKKAKNNSAIPDPPASAGAGMGRVRSGASESGKKSSRIFYSSNWFENSDFKRIFSLKLRVSRELVQKVL